MLGIKILKQSVLQVSGNFSDALKISIVLWLTSVILSTIIFQLIFSTLLRVENVSIIGLQIIGYLVSFIGIVFSALIAISWHKFVLNNERPNGWMPKLPVGLALRYIGKILLILLIIVAVFLPIGAILFVLAFVTVASSLAFGTLVPAFATLFGLYIFFRLSVILPGTALGRKIGIREAWRATSDIKFALWVPVLLLTGLQVAIASFGMLLGGGTVGNIVFNVVGWFIMILGVSVLTTIYGYCIEKRELV